METMVNGVITELKKEMIYKGRLCDMMVVFIALGSFLAGAVFGVTLMCCASINKKESEHE